MACCQLERRAFAFSNMCYLQRIVRRVLSSLDGLNQCSRLESPSTWLPYTHPPKCVLLSSKSQESSESCNVVCSHRKVFMAHKVMQVLIARRYRAMSGIVVEDQYIDDLPLQSKLYLKMHRGLRMLCYWWEFQCSSLLVIGNVAYINLHLPLQRME